MNGEGDQLVRPVGQKTLGEVENEWDKIAPYRQEQLANGEDLSFKYVLMPVVFELLEGCNLDSVLDLGCGVGNLSKELSATSTQVVGVDMSSHSIEIAKVNCVGHTNTVFHATTAEDFAERWDGPRFTVVVANMTLMTCLNLDTFVNAAARLIVRNGCLIATITHPWFWPHYWEYAEAEWFNYNEEIVLEGRFRTSAEITDYITSHVHRPISSYLNSLSMMGFQLDRLIEPCPGKHIQELFPESWHFPRFLALRARLT